MATYAIDYGLVDRKGKALRIVRTPYGHGERRYRPISMHDPFVHACTYAWSIRARMPSLGRSYAVPRRDARMKRVSLLALDE